jgi:hypothetical protein
LSQNEVAQSEQQIKAPSPEKLCASNRTYDLIKRELFRRVIESARFYGRSMTSTRFAALPPRRGSNRKST